MDMLVRLYDCPSPWDDITSLKNQGVEIHRILRHDIEALKSFIASNFTDSPGWPHEAEAAVWKDPVSCFIARDGKEIVGFVCYDSTAKGVLGPVGVSPQYRKRGIARALLRRSLFAMAEQGYAYAVIGWVASADYYRKSVGAVEIPHSEPGMYRNSL